MVSTARSDVRRISIDAAPVSIGTARRAVDSMLPCQVSDDSRADALLAISELATNAIEHGVGDTFVVQVRTMPDNVELTVESVVGADFSPADHAAPRPMSPLSQRSGRGLAIVQAVSDEFESTIRNGRFVARCRVHLRTLAAT